jgi:cell shape-determining protein MreD
MTILFYILVSLGLVIIKTTLIPGIPLFQKFYDLLIPIIIYLSFHRSLKEGLPIVLFFGLIMDSLCGGTLGLYLMIYTWLFLGMHWFSQFLHTGSILLLATAVVCGVVFEIAALLGYMAYLAPNASIPDDAAQITILQIGWALVTGPIILIIIARAQNKIDLWRHKLLVDS